MADLQELIRQKDELERQISLAQSKSRQDAIAEIRRIMQENGLAATDLTALPKTRPNAKVASTRKPVAAKYKDNQGNAWSGRGLKPKWLTSAIAGGKKLEDFAV